MKREFKEGDRVLVRNSDLQDWQVKTFRCIHSGGTPSYPFIGTGACSWTQCRHIDDFRTDDKVQVRDRVTDEWQDATYAVYLHNRPSLKHYVFHNNSLTSFKYCRWHPSMPWAEKEEIIDEPHWVRAIFRHLDAIEAKLNEK